MNQLDASAIPMSACFTDVADPTIDAETRTKSSTSADGLIAPFPTSTSEQGRDVATQYDAPAEASLLDRLDWLVPFELALRQRFAELRHSGGRDLRCTDVDQRESLGRLQ